MSWVSVVRMKKSASLPIENAPSRKILISADVQADLSLPWAHISEGKAHKNLFDIVRHTHYINRKTQKYPVHIYA